jgi:hypothetical protein
MVARFKAPDETKRGLPALTLACFYIKMHWRSSFRATGRTKSAADGFPALTDPSPFYESLSRDSCFSGVVGFKL